MTEPRHITVSLTVRTANLTPDEVRLRILAAIGDQFDINHVSAYDLDDFDDSPEIQLVVCPVRGLLGTYVDDEGRADEHAKREGAAWAGLSVGGDHRGEVTA